MCAIVLIAVMYPFSWPRTRDSFPISNYPMFSRKLPTAMFSAPYAVGVTADDGRKHLPPRLIANAEVLQAQAVLRGAIRRGRRNTRMLCRQIAERVANAGERLEQVIEVRIVRGTHDAVEYLTGRNTVGREKVHARCQVRRTRGGGS